MLNQYLQRTQLLLSDASFAVFNDADLTNWVNMARGQIAGEAQCIRAYSTLAVDETQQQYAFTDIVVGGAQQYGLSQASGTITFGLTNPTDGDTITLNGVVWTFVAGAAGVNETHIEGTTQFTITQLALNLAASVNADLTVATYTSDTAGSNANLDIEFITPGSPGNAYTLAASRATVSGATLSGGAGMPGVQGALHVRQISYPVASGAKVIHPRPWPYFNQFILGQSVPTPGAPAVWSQYGQGAAGNLFVNLLDQAYTLTLDVVAYPNNIFVDTDVEALPYLWTDAVPFYAAYFAALTNNEKEKSDMFWKEYQKFVARGRFAANPAVLPYGYAQAGDPFRENRLGLTQQSGGR